MQNVTFNIPPKTGAELSYIEKAIEKLTENLNENQIKVAISNIPNILYDESVIKKIEFYKEKRKGHLEDYLFGENIKILLDVIFLI